MKQDNIILGLFAAGLALASYLSSTAHAGSGGACSVFALLAVAPAVQAVANEEAAGLKAAPDWLLKDLDGKAVKLSEFKGKVVILNFWATWCRPCRAEIPEFVALQKQYAGKGLVIIGVAMDEGGPAAVKPFAKKTGINYPLVMGDAKTAAAYGDVEVIPTTFVIDRTGKIVTRHDGGADRATFEAEIKPLL